MRSIAWVTFKQIATSPERGKLPHSVAALTAGRAVVKMRRMSDDNERDPQSPKPPVDPGAKSAADELKDGLWKAIGAAKRIASELPTKPIEDFVQKTADAAKEAAKGASENPTVQRIQETVEYGAREVSRAVENVAHTAWDTVRGKSPEKKHEDEGQRIETDDDPGPRG